MEARMRNVLVTVKETGVILINKDLPVYVPEEGEAGIIESLKAIARDSRGSSIEIDVEFSNPKGGQA